MIRKAIPFLAIILCSFLLMASASAETPTLHPFAARDTNGRNIYGYMDRAGNVIIEPKFSIAGPFSEGLAACTDHTNLTGYINTKGQWVIPAQYHNADAREFTGGFARVEVYLKDIDKYQSFYIDKTGKRVFGFLENYLDYKSFSEGYAAVQIEGSHAWWNTVGDSVLEIKWSYIDTQGKLATTKKFDYAESFHNGYAVVRRNGNGVSGGNSFAGICGLIDEDFNLIINYKYDHIGKYSEGLFAVMKDGKWGYIDKTGKVVIGFNFDDVWETDGYHHGLEGYTFSEGFANVIVKKDVYGNAVWGYIDKTGKVMIPAKYEEAEPFSEGLAAVRLNDKWGFIDKTGKMVIAAKYSRYDNVYPCNGGLIKIWEESKQLSYYIDKTGKIIKPKI